MFKTIYSIIIKNKMRKVNFILLISVLMSCSAKDKVNEKYSYYGYDPSEMTEEEIYLTYGLDAPSSFYKNLIRVMDSNGFGKIEYHNHIKKENPLSHFISIYIDVDSLDIKSVSVEQSDYSNKFNKELERLISELEWKEIKELKKIRGTFNFRLDINKLFNSKTFEPTPPKDSTLTTTPLINEIIRKLPKL